MQAESGEIGYEEVDDACFIRTEDIMCLVCTSGDSARRGFLAAEGFGSQTCHLEPEPRNQEPCELQQCIFQLEDAMSVHAMYSSGLCSNVKQHSSCKILMYGHAVLLRHLGTKELLCSLTTSPENDKMAYNVGFDFETNGNKKERCWFRILPASNQRSEGEKVRAGDDVFLVNVANERYLFAQMSSDQNAESEKYVSKHQSSVQVSFHQCIWSLHIVCSGSAKEAAIGNVNGGDVVRFIHRYWGGGDILMVKGRKTMYRVTEWIPDNSFWSVQYERPDNNNHELRSLWRVELFQMKFGGGFTSWGQPFRLRHLITGKFLGVKEDVERAPEIGHKKQKHIVSLLSPSEASKDATAFCFVNSAVSQLKAKLQETKTHVLGMGIPEIHFGDSEVYLYHISTGKYLGFTISEHHSSRPSMDLRKAIMQTDFNQSFAFTMTRASSEQAKAATIVQLSESVMRNYVHKVLLSRGPAVGNHLETKLSNILTALIHYFRVPDNLDLSHDHYQQQLCGLQERQNLFNKQGMLKFTLTVITETAKNIRPETKRVEILHSLYQLLAAMIRGNHANCCEFATEKWLGVFMRQLSLPEVTHEVLTVIQCLLTDSPEVLNIFSPQDIGVIVNLLNTNGRDSKVMKLLSSLCVCHGVAMRDKQKLIYEHLLNCNELLVQTSHHAKVHSLHPDLYMGVKAGSAAYTKWYYEVQVTSYSATNGHAPHLRVGWAHATLFKPRPCSNSTNILDGGIGDDVFSMGFDGAQLWIGGNPVNIACDQPATPSSAKFLRRQAEVSSPSNGAMGVAPFSVGDVIGCCIDLEAEVAWFTKNGKSVKGHVRFHHCNDIITPAVSFSAGVNLVISLGGTMGGFAYTPPPRYAGLHEAAEPGRDATLIPFLCFGQLNCIQVSGPPTMSDFESFVPAPIDTSKIALPDSIAACCGSMRDVLAKNIHEVWGKNKIEAGFSYAPVRNDDLKHNPSLKAFEELTDKERSYDYNMALKTLMTLVALGYQISTEELDSSHVRYLELPPEKYLQCNGYLPRPLNLEAVDVPGYLGDLMEKLAENAHNIWASERIKEGWTYGKANDVHSKRSPLLVPYDKLSKAAKKSNYDTALESMRTVCGLGCTVTPPTSGGMNIDQLMREFSESGSRTRTFRGQKCYRVMNGKW